MIVYVETNFVLEVGRLQEEAELCEELLSLAEAGSITLVVPAFSLAEPYNTVRQVQLRRAAVHDDLTKELAQLGRTRPYAELVEKTAPVTGLLVASSQEDKERIDAAILRVCGVAEVLALTGNVVRRGLTLQKERSLQPQDALVYASVLEHVEGAARDEEKCFPNRNFKDFLTPDIEEDLGAYQCKVLPSFRDGLGYVKARIG